MSFSPGQRLHPRRLPSNRPEPHHQARSTRSTTGGRMTTQHITLIPIQEIRVVNPRSRNRVKFHSVMTSIGTVGLKKPITVHQRELADDGTRYDLVCGQGRLESVRALGDTMIPAIISD